MYQLHPVLEADSVRIGTLKLCEVRLINNASYTWLILVPQRADIREIYQLSECDQQQLMQECSEVSKQIQQLTRAEKMNVAAFGNMVPQLHLHIIARHSHDPAWPQPIWLNLQSKPYSETVLQEKVKQLQGYLKIEVI